MNNQAIIVYNKKSNIVKDCLPPNSLETINSTLLKNNNCIMTNNSEVIKRLRTEDHAIAHVINGRLIAFYPVVNSSDVLELLVPETLPPLEDTVQKTSSSKKDSSKNKFYLIYSLETGEIKGISAKQPYGDINKFYDEFGNTFDRNEYAWLDMVYCDDATNLVLDVLNGGITVDVSNDDDHILSFNLDKLQPKGTIIKTDSSKSLSDNILLEKDNFDILRQINDNLLIVVSKIDSKVIECPKVVVKFRDFFVSDGTKIYNNNKYGILNIDILHKRGKNN